LRVIAGSARGRTLHHPAGSRIRPTADRVKEALFSSLTSRFGSFADLHILDLFSGSGSLGIEAMSRGAESAVFVDSHPESLALTSKNLRLTGFDKAATLLQMDAVKALQHLSGKGMTFDIILADPPYREKELTERLLQSLAAGVLLADDGIIALETAGKLDLELPDNMGLAARKTYGDTAIWLLTIS
jgi:16S rRNA (guanine966-N2)-methyltransferase